MHDIVNGHLQRIKNALPGLFTEVCEKSGLDRHYVRECLKYLCEQNVVIMKKRNNGSYYMPNLSKCGPGEKIPELFKRKKKNKISLTRQILLFIEMMRGRQTIDKWDEEQKKFSLASGPQWLMYKLFSRGDCGRFAYLLYTAFSQYHPVICRVRYPHWKDTDYHYIVQIRNKYYDIGGVYDLKLVKKAHPKLEVLKLDTTEKIIEHRNELKGNYTTGRLFMELTQWAIPIFKIVLDFSQSPRIKIDGVNITEIDVMKEVYKNGFNNDKLSVAERIEYAKNALDRCRHAGHHLRTNTLN